MFIMSTINKEYWGLYLDGRGQPRPRGLDLDIAKIVVAVLKVENFEEFRQIVRSECATALEARVTPRAKREWFEENEEMIQESNLDKDRAYEAWTAGRIDEITSHTEIEVLDELEGEFGDGDPEEGE